MTVIAYITEAVVVTKILTHLGLPSEPPALSPARGPAQLELFDKGWGSDRDFGLRGRGALQARAQPGNLATYQAIRRWEGGGLREGVLDDAATT